MSRAVHKAIVPAAPKRAKRAETEKPRESRAAARALLGWSQRAPNIARALRRAGVGRATFYAWVNEERPTPAWGLEAIFRVTGDTRLLADWLGVGSVLIPDHATSPEDIREALLAVTEAHGRLTSVTRDALGDGRIDPEERRRINLEADAVERELCAVRISARGK